MENGLYLSGLTFESLADGSGVRAVFFVSGCHHDCHGCHSPQTHSFTNGKLVDGELIGMIKGELARRKGFISGITLSGGDPFFSADKVLDFLDKIDPERTMNLWAYTGFKIEDIWFRSTDDSITVETRGKKKQYSVPRIKDLLKRVDVLVDGPYREDYRDITLRFRGSSNQRIIDVKETLKKWVKTKEVFDPPVIYLE